MNVEFLLKIAERLERKQREDAFMASNAVDIAVKEAATSREHSSMYNIYEDALNRLASYADWLDSDGNMGTADILDAILRKAAVLKQAAKMDTKETKGLPPARELYDFKKHREESLFNSLYEASKEKVEPEFDTWKGGGHPLLTRYSPDYPGVMMYRVSDGVYQDLLSKKVYDFKNGFVSDTGIRYYGGSMAYQTPNAANYMASPQLMESKHLRVRPNR